MNNAMKKDLNRLKKFFCVVVCVILVWFVIIFISSYAENLPTYLASEFYAPGDYELTGYGYDYDAPIGTYAFHDYFEQEKTKAPVKLYEFLKNFCDKFVTSDCDGKKTSRY